MSDKQNELKKIKESLIRFSKKFGNVESEKSFSQTFWNEFFKCFGIDSLILYREFAVRKLNRNKGWIDIFIPGKLIIEQKSANQDLEKAYIQALEYTINLNEEDKPKYIIVSDFKRIILHNLNPNLDNKNSQQNLFKELKEIEKLEIKLEELADNLEYFLFLIRNEETIIKEQYELNNLAANKIAKLHDKLKENNFVDKDLEIFLTRILFCFYAANIGVFGKKSIFQNFLKNTNKDGSNLGNRINLLFTEFLNIEENKRQLNSIKLNEDLNQFPYVNGDLFKEFYRIPSFDSNLRNVLIDCSDFDWSLISPAIFGSMFQAVLNSKESDKNLEYRREFGAHYTSEENILKVIKPLFLDDLKDDLKKAGNNKNKLEELHEKISKLTFLDPACGCGNFLVIAYSELRKLEIKIIDKIKGENFDIETIDKFCLIKLENFYGLELDEAAASIAGVALYITHLKMNEETARYFGKSPKSFSLPLLNHIFEVNSIRENWNNIFYKSYEKFKLKNKKNNKNQELNQKDKKEQELKSEKFNYILGNPPFLGSAYQNKEQKEDLKFANQNAKGTGILDYVTAWYFKAAEYLKKNEKTQIAFVSTNSITQGEQPGILWSNLNKIADYKLTINFGYRSFKWENEAPNQAAVYCVIIGFSNRENICIKDKPKLLFSEPIATKQEVEIKEQNKLVKILKFATDSERIKHEKENPKKFKLKTVYVTGKPKIVSQINPYLIEADFDLIIEKRTKPISENIPEMVYGSKPTDGGFLLINSKEEKDQLIKDCQGIEKYIKPFINGNELINNIERWCLWLVDLDSANLSKFLKQSKLFKARIEGVKQMRLNSVKIPTQKLAKNPTLFAEIRQPKNNYLAIPLMFSSNYESIPMEIKFADVVPSSMVQTISNISLYHLGILMSKQHLSWMKQIAGRMGNNGYLYSGTIVYNNFVWPAVDLNNKNNKKQIELIKKIEESAQNI